MRTLSNAAMNQQALTQQAQKDVPLVEDVDDKISLGTESQKVDNIGAFADMLNRAFETVNELQNDSSNKQTRFDLGDRSVTLSDVMIASQKSSISFDATIQVRNKMIEAYKTISQMQI